MSQEFKGQGSSSGHDKIMGNIVERHESSVMPKDGCSWWLLGRLAAGRWC